MEIGQIFCVLSPRGWCVRGFLFLFFILFCKLHTMISRNSAAGQSHRNPRCTPHPFTHLASHTQCTALLSFPASTTIFSAILLEAACYPSRTPVCVRAREPVQTVNKRTFGSAHLFFTNSVPPEGWIKVDPGYEDTIHRAHCVRA